MKKMCDASCTMALLRSCAMHDYFVGNFDDMELLPVRGCQKRTQDPYCKLLNVLKLN